MKQYILILFILLSCNSAKHHEDPAGIYTTYSPGFFESLMIEKDIPGKLYPMPLVLFYLRTDSTYVLGYCDNQVREAGRYSIQADSILLFDRYHLVRRESVQERKMYIDREKNMIVLSGQFINTKHSNIIPLRKDQKAHYGFLRGQEMSIDALLHHYQQHSVEEQNKWSDSMQLAAEK